ncbi:kinase-like domain-containing protein, partial [Mycena galopus ATCC 62051]
MANGHILQFLETAPPDTDHVSLMLDVAMGLEYLHGKRVVHGDLKGMNILVTPSGRACVADFGLSTVADAMTLRFTHSTASPKGGTARYQAPDYTHGESSIYEIPRDVTVMIKVLEGIRPSRPETMPADDKLWVLMQDCWREKPCDRPSISEIVQRLVAIGAKAAESTTDWDETFSSRSRRSFQ